jgi:hypothetical protein
LALHVSVLLSPGWSLPFDDEPDAAPLDAVLAPPARPAVRAAPVAPPPRKKLPPKPATPAAPVAQVPGETPAEQAQQPAPGPAAASEPEPVAAAAANALPAVPPAPTFARDWPRQGRIVFQVTRGEDGMIIGRSVHTWHHDGSSYNLRAVTETTGLAALFRPAEVMQESRGGFDAAGLRPGEFDALRDGKPRDSVRFEPEQGRIRFGRSADASFVPAVQDMLSLFYQLGAVNLDGPRAGIAVATGRKVATFAVVIGEAKDMETPLGLRRAQHLKITGTAAEDSTEIWLDIQSHLPLRIRHRDRKGEVFDQTVTLIELDQPQ